MRTIEVKLNKSEISAIQAMITYVLTDFDVDEKFEDKLYNLEEKMMKLKSKLM